MLSHLGIEGVKAIDINDLSKEQLIEVMKKINTFIQNYGLAQATITMPRHLHLHQADIQKAYDRLFKPTHIVLYHSDLQDIINEIIDEIPPNVKVQSCTFLKEKDKVYLIPVPQEEDYLKVRFVDNV